MPLQLILLFVLFCLTISFIVTRCVLISSYFTCDSRCSTYALLCSRFACKILRKWVSSCKGVRNRSDTFIAFVMVVAERELLLLLSIIIIGWGLVVPSVWPLDKPSLSNRRITSPPPAANGGDGVVCQSEGREVWGTALSAESFLIKYNFNLVHKLFLQNYIYF